MSVELESISKVKKVGKTAKYTVKLSGDLEDIECVLTLKAESEAAITDIIPVFSKNLIIKLIDPNTTLEDFQPKEPAILEEFVLGFVVEKAFIAGQCSECGADLWKDPDDLRPLCVACQKENETQKSRKAAKEFVKQKRTTPGKKEECPVFKLPDETWEEYEVRKQLIEEQQFRAERVARAEAQA